MYLKRSPTPCMIWDKFVGSRATWKALKLLEGVETADYQVADTLHQLEKERERQEKSKNELFSESSDGVSSSSQRRSGVFLEQCGYMVTIRNDAQVGFYFFRFVNI